MHCGRDFNSRRAQYNERKLRMSMTKATCLLCDCDGASSKATDHGNCLYFACPAAGCGNYETSNRAARLLAGNAAIKSMLREMVRNATAGSQVIGISVDSAGQLQAAIITT